MKDTVVAGSLRATDTLFSTTAQFNILRIPTSSNGTTYGPGSNGQILKSNGTSVYWAADNDTTSLASMTGVLSIPQGGTGAITDSSARTNLGLGNVSNNGNLNNVAGAKGDIIYWSATNTPAHLTNTSSTTKQFLSITSQVPSWSSVSKSDVGLGNVENTALSTWAGTNKITTLGTITTGIWQGTAIAASYIGNHSTDKLTSGTLPVSRGGTGQTSIANIQAGKDGDGNTISSKYVTIDTTQTITGTKSWGSDGAGGLLNGAATNGGINSIKIGDDVWLGDCNTGGIIGMKSTGTNCGFYMYNNSGTQIGKLYFDGTNLVCDKNINANAATATALTSNAGGTEQPIYFSSGKPVATSYALKATVNNGTNYFLAEYDNNGRALSPSGLLRIPNINYNTVTPNYTSGGEQYYKAAIKYIAANYSNADNLIVCFTPNSTGPFIGQIYSVSDKDSSTGLPRYSTFIFHNLSDGLESFGTVDCNYYYRRYLHNENYTDYTVTKTGSGASGTWGITASGNVAKTGDTMTGKLTFNKVQNAIAYTGTKASYDMIKFIDNTGDEYGNGISIGGGGATIIGGGESADVAAAQVSGGNEILYLCNDGDVNIFPNMQDGWDSRKTFTFNTSGNIIPPAGCRIGESGGALYLGNSGNQSWVYIQDMCSQSGSDKWKILANGTANFAGTVTVGTLSLSNALSVSNGGTGATNATDARTNLQVPQVSPGTNDVQIAFFSFKGRDGNWYDLIIYNGASYKIGLNKHGVGLVWRF